MGTFTIPEVHNITYKHYKTRFTYYKRDVVKSIKIKEIKTIERHDRPGEPRVLTKYWIISKSYPQYPPYVKKGQSRQRRIAHEYDVMLEMDELTLTTKNWRMRVGSGKKWMPNPPQSMIKTLYPRTKKTLKNKALRHTQTQREANTLYKQYVEKHKKRAKYLDTGDYNSRVLGLNGDFIFRCSFAYWKAGHLWGRNYYGNVPATVTNPLNIVFFTKHQLGVMKVLMNSGVLK